jgi:hypothetical protein
VNNRFTMNTATLPSPWKLGGYNISLLFAEFAAKRGLDIGFLKLPPQDVRGAPQWAQSLSYVNNHVNNLSKWVLLAGVKNVNARSSVPVSPVGGSPFRISLFQGQHSPNTFYS